MILFLDFDGVLHPVSALIKDTFSHLPNLEKVLRDYPHVQVVISSWWRHDGLERCRQFFSHDIALRIVGHTPFNEEKSGVMALARTRHTEILEWIEANKYTGPWIALDDDIGGFPVGCVGLIQCGSEEAFDDEAERRLREFFKAHERF